MSRLSKSHLGIALHEHLRPVRKPNRDAPAGRFRRDIPAQSSAILACRGLFLLWCWVKSQSMTGCCSQERHLATRSCGRVALGKDNACNMLTRFSALCFSHMLRLLSRYFSSRRITTASKRSPSKRPSCKLSSSALRDLPIRDSLASISLDRISLALRL